MKNSLLLLTCLLSLSVFAITNELKVNGDLINEKPLNLSLKDTIDPSNKRAANFISVHFIELKIGNSMTTFDYVNSSGKSPHDFVEGQSTFIEMNYNIKLFSSVYLKTGLNLMGFNTTAQDQVNGNFYSWKTTYAGLGTGINWNLFSLGKFNGFIYSTIGYSGIIRGDQQINQQTLSITNHEDFKGSNWFFSHGFSFLYKLSNEIMLGINGSVLANSKNSLGPYPTINSSRLVEGQENIKLKSKNIGISILYSIN